MLRLVEEPPPEPAEHPGLTEFQRETIANWRVLADAHRVIANSGNFTLRYRLQNEEAALAVDRSIADYVKRHTTQLDVVPEPEPGPYVDELVVHGITPSMRNALVRAGYRTIESARIFVERLPEDLDELVPADLPRRVGRGTVEALREALRWWDVAGDVEGFEP